MENDLISRSAILEELSKGAIITDDYYGMGIMAGNDHAIKKIEAAPSVDAETVFEQMGLVKEAMDMAKADLVAVVRCKDCAVPHNRWTGCPNLNGLIPPDDFFCAIGERKVDHAD